MAVATIPIESFGFTKGKATGYESSPGWMRIFCSTCGTSLGMHAAEAPKLMDVTVVCLDDPNFTTKGRPVAGCHEDDLLT